MLVTVVIPVAGTRSASHDAWRECVGTGRLSLALRQDYLESLALVQKEIGFRYIRGHGLLHDDVGIYREYEWEGEIHVLYNFTYIDQIFDSFLDLGLKPFVEIGFMPAALASSTETIFWWKGNVTPPKDYGRWRDLIHAVVTHFVGRYGLEEVITWPFEIWNEPNLSNFWKDADQAEYFKLYRETVGVIKAIDPGLQVGGPAISGGSDHWMADFLRFCADEKVPVDFLSRHAYSSGPRESIPFAAYQEIATPESLLAQFATAIICIGSPARPASKSWLRSSLKARHAATDQRRPQAANRICRLNPPAFSSAPPAIARRAATSRRAALVTRRGDARGLGGYLWRIHRLLQRASLNGDLNLRLRDLSAGGYALDRPPLSPQSGLGIILREDRDFCAYGSPEELLPIEARYLLARAGGGSSPARRRPQRAPMAESALQASGRGVTRLDIRRRGGKLDDTYAIVPPPADAEREVPLKTRLAV